MGNAFAQSPSPGVLPVFIADDHAETFGWITRLVDLDESHALLLIDAHSDGTTAARSDTIRRDLRAVRSKAERAARVEAWRGSGRVQAYSWIEPLMPAPIAEVLWLPRWKLTAEESQVFRQAAAEDVDGRVEFERREAGELAARWQVREGAALGEWKPSLPVIVSIDLDFFVGQKAEDAAARFSAMWRQILTLPRLRGVSFAVSRPWLRDDAEAWRLLALALEEVRLVRGAVIEWEAFLPARRDDSLEARKYAAAGQPVPRLDLQAAPAEIAAHCLALGARLTLGRDQSRADRLWQEWRESIGSWEIQVEGGFRHTDGIWRAGRGAAGALWLTALSHEKPPARVRWWGLVPVHACYNLLPEMDLGKEFTAGADAWIRERRVFLAETTDAALAAEKWQALLQPADGFGRVRLEAEIETAAGWRHAAEAEIRVLPPGSAFRQGLGEQFGLPYAFGIGFVRSGALTGPDTHCGNDCANFLIAAWRRAGASLAWSDPLRLTAQLAPIARRATLQSEVRFSEAQAEAGIAIDFGRHAAALWEDRAPLGILTADDLVAHHLSGFPEVIPLGELARTRPKFTVSTLPPHDIRIALGGDIVLADLGDGALEELPALVREADLAVANLEGPPAEPQHPRRSVRYNFAFPKERLKDLQATGIDAVGLAHNHAADAGAEPLQTLEAMGGDLPIFGAGRNTGEAIRPWRIEVRGTPLAFLAVCGVEAEAARHHAAGVAALPAHESEIAAVLHELEAEGRTTIVLMHWGSEYSPTPHEEQRHWARWLIDRGADAIAGAHPHVVQPLDFHRGKPIAFSLGNAVYPEKLRGADSGAWLELRLDKRGRILGATLLPTKETQRAKETQR